MNAEDVWMCKRTWRIVAVALMLLAIAPSSGFARQDGDDLIFLPTLTETSGQDEVTVSVYVWRGNGGVTGASTAEDVEEISGPGGIGNTREDVLAHWDIDERDDPTGELIEDGFHYILYDLPDYQISFMFLLQGDSEPRATDRAVDIIISWISPASRSNAERRVEGWLPDDAERVGSVERNDIGEVIYRYESETVAEQLPSIDYPGFDEPGGIWVAYWPETGNVGVVELSLFHPRGN